MKIRSLVPLMSLTIANPLNWKINPAPKNDEQHSHNVTHNPLFYIQTILIISRKSIDMFFRNIPRRHGFLRRNEMKCCVQGITRNIHKIIQIFPYLISDLSWKYHESFFTWSSVMLLTAKVTNRPFYGSAINPTCFLTPYMYAQHCRVICIMLIPHNHCIFFSFFS